MLLAAAAGSTSSAKSGGILQLGLRSLEELESSDDASIDDSDELNTAVILAEEPELDEDEDDDDTRGLTFALQVADEMDKDKLNEYSAQVAEAQKNISQAIEKLEELSGQVRELPITDEQKEKIIQKNATARTNLRRVKRFIQFNA